MAAATEPGALPRRPSKVNCWEFMRCGREPGGARVAEVGVCPAAIEIPLNGVFQGVNAGRCCWAVAGTFCKDQPEGTFAKRFADCRECDFFKKVAEEEYPLFWQAASLVLYVTASEGWEQERHLRLLKAFIDPAVVRSALKNPKVLEATQERHVTAFFSDLTGFSRIATKLAPADLGQFLSEYLAAMTAILRSEGGTLDKYIGDAVVGIFGAPEALENDAVAAARAALRMQQRLSELRDEWRARGAWCPDTWSLRMRIGLSSGLVKVGLMGTADFATYTMTGASVNLGRWLEQRCKKYGVAILVGEATRDLIAGDMILRRIDTVHPKGDGREAIYELLGARSTAPPAMIRAAEAYEAALALHDRGCFSAAAKLLRRSQNLREDAAAARLLRRCERRRSRRRRLVTPC